MTCRDAVDGDWRTRGACAKPTVNIDFTAITTLSGGGQHPDTDAALTHCRDACPVLAECLRFALCHGDVSGVAGGMTEIARKKWRLAHGVRVRNLVASDFITATSA